MSKLENSYKVETWLVGVLERPMPPNEVNVLAWRKQPRLPWSAIKAAAERIGVIEEPDPDCVMRDRWRLPDVQRARWVAAHGGSVESGVEVVAVGAKGAGTMFGMSDRSWRRLNSAGLCPAPVRLNGAVRWRVDELQRWGAAGCPSRPRWVETMTR